MLPGVPAWRTGARLGGQATGRPWPWRSPSHSIIFLLSFLLIILGPQPVLGRVLESQTDLDLNSSLTPLLARGQEGCAT